MFYLVLTGVIIAYFSIIFFAGIEKAIEKRQETDQGDE